MIRPAQKGGQRTPLMLVPEAKPSPTIPVSLSDWFQMGLDLTQWNDLVVGGEPREYHDLLRLADHAGIDMRTCKISYHSVFGSRHELQKRWLLAGIIGASRLIRVVKDLPYASMTDEEYIEGVAILCKKLHKFFLPVSRLMFNIGHDGMPVSEPPFLCQGCSWPHKSSRNGKYRLCCIWRKMLESIGTG
jgi:hypothetical protein